MNQFLLPKDVAKQLKDAEKAANEAAHDQLKAEREARKERRVALIAKWKLPEKAPTRIGRASFQQIWNTGLWQMLDKVNGTMDEPRVFPNRSLKFLPIPKFGINLNLPSPKPI